MSVLRTPLLRPVIIFDFDGTLADSVSPVMDYVFTELLPKHKIKNFTPAQIAKLRNYSIGQILWKMKWNFWKFPRLVADLLEWQKTHRRDIRPFPAIPRTIKNLAAQGYNLIILTSNEADNVRAILDENNQALSQYFIDIIPSKGIFNKPRALRELLNAYELSTDEVLYVGDEIRDVKACRSVGISIAAVTYGLNSERALKKAKANYLLDEPDQLLALVEKITNSKTR